MDNILTNGIESCCGCSACVNVCPRQCISMEQNDEGFLAPQIDEESCVHCGACIKHCPVECDMKKVIPSQTYAATSKDVRETARSSSGGAFFEIAQHFISHLGGYVCGCVMDDGYIIRHILTNSYADLAQIQGSKYVQSNIAEIIPQIQKTIKDGTPVLFSGTPCQVAAVRTIIGESEILYTIDTVCHGVTSPGMFREYMEKTYHGNHLDSFRYKNPYEISTYAFSFKNGKRINGQLDPFFNSFLRGRSFRESCYSCKFACPKRIGDITLGDCANFRAYPSLAGKPISTVLINTEKGTQIWNGIRDLMNYVDADYAKESKLNHQLNSPAKRPIERATFYSDLKTMSKSEFAEKYAEHWNMKTKIKRFIIMHVPYSIRSAILK